MLLFINTVNIFLKYLKISKVINKTKLFGIRICIRNYLRAFISICIRLRIRALVLGFVSGFVLGIVLGFVSAIVSEILLGFVYGIVSEVILGFVSAYLLGFGKELYQVLHKDLY